MALNSIEAVAGSIEAVALVAAELDLAQEVELEAAGHLDTVMYQGQGLVGQAPELGQSGDEQAHQAIGLAGLLLREGWDNPDDAVYDNL